jgi:hypothetical protein
MLKAILEKCAELELFERRTVEDEYCEVVAFTRDIEKWTTILGEVLGPPVKPPGTKPSREDKRSSKEYGGVNRDQTLFRREIDGRTVIVMFWPWGDGEHVTVKAAVLQ